MVESFSLYGCEVEVASVETVSVGVDSKAVGVVGAVKKNAISVFSVLEGIVLLQGCFGNHRAFCREVERKQFVFQLQSLRVRVYETGKRRVFRRIVCGFAHFFKSRIVEQSVFGTGWFSQVGQWDNHVALHCDVSRQIAVVHCKSNAIGFQRVGYSFAGVFGFSILCDNSCDFLPFIGVQAVNSLLRLFF